MKYVDRKLCIELHPESEEDRDYIRRHYSGGQNNFDHWCVAKTRSELTRSEFVHLFG